MNKFCTALICLLTISSVHLSADNLLKNSDFETLDSTGEFVSNWGKHWINKGEYIIENNPEKTQNGMIAIGLKSDSKQSPIVSMGSDRIKVGDKRKFTFTIYAKGKGRLGVNTYLYNITNYVTAEKPADDFAKWVNVNSTSYQKFTFNFEIPAKGISNVDKAILPIDGFEILLNVEKGPIFIDNLELNYEGESESKPNFKFESAQSPYMVISKINTAPKMDGLIDDKTWQEASATTGMHILGGVFSPRQTIFYCGFDEENLYIAFESKQNSLLLGAGTTGDKVVLGVDTEGVELWFKTPEKRILQFLGVPAGGYATASVDNKFNNWGKNIRFASHILESKDMMGGILTLGNKVWTGEIIIPFSNLGSKAPANGDTWRINFCRDYSTENKSARTQSDWTSWGKISSSFTNSGEYGFVKFDRTAKPFQLTGIGNPAEGAMLLTGNSGEFFSAGLSFNLLKPVKTVFQKIDKVDKTGAFSLANAIKIQAKGITPMQGNIIIQDAETQKLIAQNSFDFTLMPTFWIKSKILYSKNKVIVDVDSSRSALPQESSAVITICDPVSGKVMKEATHKIDLKHPKFSLELDFADLKSGKYMISAKALDKKGQELALTTEPLNIPARPHWMGNHIGYNENIVPPPFTPVLVNQNKVSVILRNYNLGDNGFPRQITAKNIELLSSPIRLDAVINQKNVNWNFKPLKLIKSTPQSAEFSVDGSSEYLDLTGTLTVEYDGFAVFNMSFVPKGKVTIDALKISVPMNRKIAMFARGDGFTAASLFHDKYTDIANREDVVKLGNIDTEWGSWEYSRKGWIWKNKFFNEVYVGDDQVGFSIMNEGSSYIRGPRYAEIEPDGEKTMLMTINILSKPLTISDKLDYTYCYQTMPLKPEPLNPKIWHNSYDPGSAYNFTMDAYKTPEAIKHMEKLYVGHAYYDLTPDGYPDVTDKKAVDSGIATAKKLGMKLVHNLWYGAIADSLPEYKDFGAEWDALPKFGWTTPNSHLTSACLVSGFQDFHIWCTKGIIDEVGFDGVYTDATPIQCQNQLHGCGYIDENGKLQSTLNFLATRNFVKRMYMLLKADGKDRINFSHSGEGGATGAFNDLRTHGEEICWEGESHYKRITPDYFRAKYAQNEYGVPYSFFPVFYYSWRVIGKVTPIQEALMMSLAHRVGITIAHMDTEMNQVWDCFDPWWTSSDFIAYWKPESPVKTSDELNVTASTFLKKAEKKALTVLSNWNYHNSSITLNIDSKKIGFTPEKIVLLDVLSGKSVTVDANAKIDIPARDFRVILFN